LFDGFSGTMSLSDCSEANMLGLRPPAFSSRTDSRTLYQSLPSPPGSRTWSVCTCNRSLTPGSRTGTRAIAPAHIAFPTVVQGQPSQAVISELNTVPAHSPTNASPRHHWSSTHSSGPERIATPYSVEDFHLLLHAGFHRRFHNVPCFYLANSLRDLVRLFPKMKPDHQP